MKTTIYIFDKISNDYLGLIEYVNDHFRIKIKDSIQCDNLKNFLKTFRPGQIIGVPQNNTIVDMFYNLTPKNPHFIDSAIYELSGRFNEYYFIAVETPINWRKIEDELSLYFTSGVLEEKEHSELLKKLFTLQSEQIILIHDQLKQAYNFFVAV